MKKRTLKLTTLAFSLLLLTQQASASCACYGRKYYRSPVTRSLTYKDEFIASTSDRYTCDILAGRLGYDAFYLHCGY